MQSALYDVLIQLFPFYVCVNVCISFSLCVVLCLLDSAPKHSEKELWTVRVWLCCGYWGPVLHAAYKHTYNVFMNSGQCEVVITADQGVRGGKTLELKKIVNDAVEGLDFVRHVFYMKRTGGPFPSTPKDVSLEEVCV